MADIIQLISDALANQIAAGEVVQRDWASQLPRPNAHTLSVWPQAKALAFQFWQSAASDVRISEEFRAVAKVNEGLVNGL